MKRIPTAQPAPLHIAFRCIFLGDEQEREGTKRMVIRGRKQRDKDKGVYPPVPHTFKIKEHERKAKHKNSINIQAGRLHIGLVRFIDRVIDNRGWNSWKEFWEA
ncbi:hypothetical protein ZHAS_00014949 [Anopheles sinensis]|uniref:Uncharacterized protein n=1 Tax=Anopheles sinensis TaxID=74873 RepID=A0A084W9P3_ANOSI|nr:hypothetical protein ZHAS_00014949 [Anopheles sinensis]